MESVMTLLVQVLLLGVLALFFALVGAACYAVVWFAFHAWRNHFSLLKTWHEGRDRLLGTSPH